MSQFDTATLSDLTNRTVSGGTISSTDHEAWRNDVESRVQDLNDAAQAIATSQSGSSEPSNVIQGQLFFDTDDTAWFGAPDTNNHDDQLLTELTAYLGDLATAGTATFRLGGAINVDTAQVSKAGATGVLESYTLPAGTLARDGQYVRIIIWGTKSGGNADSTIQVRFNTGAQHSFTLAAAVTDWFIEWYIVRTGATAQKFVAGIILNRDDTGDTDLVGTGTDAETLANGLAIDANLSAINASDTVVKEGMIIEFGNI